MKPIKLVELKERQWFKTEIDSKPRQFWGLDTVWHKYYFFDARWVIVKQGETDE